MSGFLLDTVTISELRKNRRAHPRVVAWQAAEAAAVHWLSVVTVMEIRIGLLRVRKKNPAFSAHLKQWLEETLLVDFAAHLLPVTLPVADRAATLRTSFGMSTEDALIAATAELHSLRLATRNVSDFAQIGIELVNPWEDLP